MTIEDAASSDRFFYYGQLPLAEEVESDLIQGLLQASRSRYYSRQDSAGVDNFINAPASLSTQINMKYQIAQWFAYRNGYVADGQNKKPDRRAATSQDAIAVTVDNTGSMAVKVGYIQFSGPKAGETSVKTSR